MTDVQLSDLRTMPLPDTLAWLREHGEPADPRPGIDTASLRRRFPRLAHVRTRDLVVEAPSGPQPARLYRDDTVAPSGAALVWAHGGGFIGGHLDMPESNWVALELAARGIPSLAVDYTKCLGTSIIPCRPTTSSPPGSSRWRTAPNFSGSDPTSCSSAARARAAT
ncbi:hypothetical protein A0130_13410 [Leifsonia xyli]|uniref:hypothetical protein n=1 Tax=Leifsonia xyli TaxID=1575 RepID=UPI0007CE0BC4|nr:hypothetical protein A0130_13410 [Leifsonia xyli]